MVFYESVHCGILRIEINEQFIWSWLTQHDKSKNIDVNRLALLCEDELNMHAFCKPLILDEIIMRVYRKYVGQ